MEFRTQLPPFDSPFQLTYGVPILSLGSCFAEHIGQRLIDRKFQVAANPFGILYNPLSIVHSIEQLQSGRSIERGELFHHQDLWHHFDFHGRYAHPDLERALEQMNASVSQVHAQWMEINSVLITWGTAFAFRHRKEDRIVGNCHKLPGSIFERVRLQIEDIAPAYLRLLTAWKAAQPDLQVLISVSPVRHLRDGLVDNQRSKSILLLAAELLAAKLEFVHYFPAYELVIDDLRDYRFYEADLTHPNHMAVDYVWEYFAQSCLTDEAKAILRELTPLLRAAAHRPFHTDTPAFRQFRQKQSEKIKQLETHYPFLDLSMEKKQFGIVSG